MPPWLTFATQLADRRGLFQRGGLSQIQDFLLKVDLALTQPMTESKKQLAMLRRDIGIAQVTKGADPRKVFPALQRARHAQRMSAEKAIDHEGPVEIISTMTAAEAMADIEQLLRAERAGSLSADELFTPPETNHDDHRPSR